jgi:glucokinase
MNPFVNDEGAGNYALGLDLGSSCVKAVAVTITGAALASAVWLKSTRALAAGIASLVNVLDPEIVVLGGGIARSGEALFKPLAGFLDQFEWRPGGHRAKILPAEQWEFAGALGAAAKALGRFQ